MPTPNSPPQPPDHQTGPTETPSAPTRPRNLIKRAAIQIRNSLAATRVAIRIREFTQTLTVKSANVFVAKALWFLIVLTAKILWKSVRIIFASLRFTWRWKFRLLAICLALYVLGVYIGYRQTQLSLAEFLYIDWYVPELTLQFLKLYEPGDPNNLINHPRWQITLAQLPVKNVKSENPAPFNYDDWPYWSDLDGDCQPTPSEVLIARSEVPVTLTPDGCHVDDGRWRDHWNGKIIYGIEGVSIDHLVHVSEAHQRSTADMWNYQRRERFANDPNNLFVVENSTHRAKRWKPPHQWLPEKNRCRYLYQWIAVKSAYRLSITNQEKASLEKLFPRHC